MKRVTLGDVAKECLENKEFFEELVKDAASALRKADFEVSPEEMQELEKLLQNPTVTINILDFLRSMHEKRPPIWSM